MNQSHATNATRVGREGVHFDLLDETRLQQRDMYKMSMGSGKGKRLFEENACDDVAGLADDCKSVYGISK